MAEINNKLVKEKLYEVMFALDSKSANRDLVAIRKCHYDNMKWLHDVGLQEEYYQYFVKHLD